MDEVALDRGEHVGGVVREELVSEALGQRRLAPELDHVGEGLAEVAREVGGLAGRLPQRVAQVREGLGPGPAAFGETLRETADGRDPEHPAVRRIALDPHPGRRDAPQPRGLESDLVREREFVVRERELALEPPRNLLCVLVVHHAALASSKSPACIRARWASRSVVCAPHSHQTQVTGAARHVSPSRTRPARHAAAIRALHIMRRR